jgi:hypothetical protein
MTKFLTDRIKKTPPDKVSEERYKFLKLSEAEPDLGIAPANNSFLTSNEEGFRYWLQLGSGLDLDNTSIIGAEDTFIIDTSTFLNSSANTLAEVLSDFDQQLTIAVSDTLQTVTDRGNTTSNSITISSNADSSNTSTGSLVIEGGVGIGKSLYVDGPVLIGDVVSDGVSKLEIDGRVKTTSLVSDTVVDSRNINAGEIFTVGNILIVNSNTGRIGVKTATPIAGVDINDDVRVRGDIAASYITNDTYEISPPDLIIATFNPASILIGTNSELRMKFEETGETLVNLPQPFTQDKFQVSGGIFTDTLTLTGSLSANGSIGTSGKILTSDGTKAFWSDDTTFVIDTSALLNSSANTLSEVLRDLDDAISGAVIVANSAITSVSTDDSLSGDGSDGSPLSVVKWATPITITLTGDVSGNVSIDGSNNVTIDVSTNTPQVGEVVSITKSLTLDDDWQDVGISGTDLETGSYVIQLFANDTGAGGLNTNEYYTGYMSWFSGTTTESLELPNDEIVLHRAGGGSDAGLYLRTLRANILKMQIYSNVANASSSNYVFKFRRMI